MTFPAAPTNGETAVVNGITYTYTTATDSWTRVKTTFANIASNVVPSANLVFNIGSPSYQWGNLYSNSIYTETLSVATLLGNTTISGNLIPGANLVYNLGSSDFRFKDLWLSGNTIYVSGAKIEANATALILTNPQGGQFVFNALTNVGTTIALAGGSGSGSVAGGGTLTVNGTTNQITTTISSSTITIALAQDVTAPGNLTVTGNLVVQGNTTTLNTETLTVEGFNITVANGAATAAAADGAGLTVAGANARLLYKSATDSWVFDKGVFASGNLVANSGTVSSSVSTGALVVQGGAGIAGNVYMDTLYTTNGLYWAGNGNVIVTGGGAVLGFPNSTVSTFPTGDYGDFTATKDAFGVHIDTVYDLMEPIGSIVTVDLN